MTFPVGAVVWLCGRCGLALLCQDAQLLPRRHVPAHNPNNYYDSSCGPFNVILHALSPSDIDFIEIYRPFFSHGDGPTASCVLTSTVGS